MEDATSNPTLARPLPAGATLAAALAAPGSKQFIGLVLLFSSLLILPLIELTRYSLAHSLYSHLVLIPLTSLYLALFVAPSPQTLNTAPAPAKNWRLALAPLALAACFLYLAWANRGAWQDELRENYLAAVAAGYVALLWAAAALSFSKASLQASAFPLLFLICMIPFPVPVRDAIEYFFQHASAETAYRMLDASGMAIWREGTTFRIPGIVLEVAPECSGIRSSLVLFIVSIVAGYMFLRSPWRRAAIVLFVSPLAIVRNAFRWRSSACRSARI